MEILLLWIDELDDALGALRHLAPKILGFVCAAVLFAGTVIASILTPQITLAVAAFVLSATLVEAGRRRLVRKQVKSQDH
jgi:hypothetical protein